MSFDYQYDADPQLRELINAVRQYEQHRVACQLGNDAVILHLYIPAEQRMNELAAAIDARLKQEAQP